MHEDFPNYSQFGVLLESLSKFKLVELLLQKCGHFLRILDWVVSAHTVPFVDVVIVEEFDPRLTSEEAPVVSVWNELSVEPFGIGLITGGPLKSSGTELQRDEAGHEDHPVTRTELNLLSRGVPDEDSPFVV